MRTRALVLPVAALCAALLAGASGAADDVGTGRFQIHTAYSELIDGVYYLNADIEYSLDEPALKALESSLPLTIKVEIELIRDRRFVWDETVARFEHVDQIAFHPLSQRYLVREMGTGEVESFASYRAAVARLGQVSDVPLIDSRLLEADSRYRVRIRASLDLEEYSTPLRVYAKFWQDWTISSEWYEWVLR